MTLTELRAAAAAALDGLDEDWAVHAAPVDALTPPAFVLEWSDPWLLPAGYCQSTAALDVVVVAARLEPDAQYDTLDAMVGAAYAALAAARLTPAQTSAPLPLDVAQVNYLSARLLIRQPVDVPGT